jgi:SNF2 family DNA or RNA helicase
LSLTKVSLTSSRAPWMYPDRQSSTLAHHIRNRSSKTFDAACAIRARYRWCLTGTPIHNRLDDYGALLSFIGVPPFTSKALFDYWLANPMSNNNPEGLRRLKELVAATCLRRTKDAVKDQLKLPQRINRVETIELDSTERELYDFFKVRTSSLVAGMFSEESWASQQHQGNILPLINFLRLICDHGERLLPTPALKAWLSRDASAFDWNILRSSGRNCALCKVDISKLQCQNALRYEFCLHVICSKCAITDDEENSMDDDWCPICNRESATPSQQLASSLSKNTGLIAMDYWPSTKVKALLKNLRQEQRLNDTDLKEAPTKRHATIRT